MKKYRARVTVFALVSRMELREKHFPDRKRNHHESNTPSSNYNFERSGCWDAVGPRGKRVCSGRSAGSIRQAQLMQDSQDPLELATSAGLARDLSNPATCEEPVDRWNVEFSVYLHG